VSARKRICIHPPPPTLCVHLKRFNTNFETLTTEKINQKFAFPTTEPLDLYPYSLMGIAAAEGRHVASAELIDKTRGGDSKANPGDWQYRLKGVVVHSGSALAGHYLSYVRVQPRKIKP
jgi:ubiquitin C-terminal hydrolase